MPTDFVVYHISGFNHFGSFSAYQKPDSRLNFLIYAKVRKFNHEYITDIEEGFTIDCFWVQILGKNYGFISEKSILLKTDYEKHIIIYKKYFEKELGVTLDGIYLITGSRRNWPVYNRGIIKTREIKKLLKRGKL
jgi:hypothetical protein